jgi:hypothetical protein
MALFASAATILSLELHSLSLSLARSLWVCDAACGHDLSASAIAPHCPPRSVVANASAMTMFNRREICGGHR